ncbi:MAG TPA: GNAT family N-acetyltransferase [Ktedonobacterales bacterium]|nr:GNAT family N-acetyltransferase [Ktedonobacterales bacterium]
MQGASVQIHQATVRDTQTVVALVQRLLSELGGFQSFDAARSVALCEQLLATDRYTAFLARGPQGEAIGVLTLQECPALYVAGHLGWIQELYVAPEARSWGVGHQLLLAAEAYGRQRQWQRLEVNTPDAAAWPRTVAFYQREGFAGGALHLRKTLTEAGG